jgi:hypothetical protein
MGQRKERAASKFGSLSLCVYLFVACFDAMCAVIQRQRCHGST